MENYWTHCWKWEIFSSQFHFTGDGAGASDGRKADKTRERLVFPGMIQGCGANVKFLSKQPFSIRMTYFCSERHVGGIVDHVAKKPQPPAEAFFFFFFSSAVVVCLIGTLTDAFLTSVTE